MRLGVNAWVRWLARGSIIIVANVQLVWHSLSSKTKQPRLSSPPAPASALHISYFTKDDAIWRNSSEVCAGTVYYITNPGIMNKVCSLPACGKVSPRFRNIETMIALARAHVYLDNG
jgi:hypothetical protein